MFSKKKKKKNIYIYIYTYIIYSLLLLRKSDYYHYLFMKDNKQSHGLMRVTL